MDTSRRSYRNNMTPEGFVSFSCKIKETDLHVSVDQGSYTPQLAGFVEERVLLYRTELESYIVRNPQFYAALEPYIAQLPAPSVAMAMIRAGNMAGVGPMAAVAGTFAELVGRDLLQCVKQVIVENGGDIFISTLSPVRIAVFAGASPFSNRLVLEMPCREDGFGVCTSSGTVGPSLSLGRADAAVIISASTPLADAVATAAGNFVQSAADLPAALEFAKSVSRVEGVLLIKGDKMAAWGSIKLLS